MHSCLLWLGSCYGIYGANKDGHDQSACALNLEFSDEKQKIIKIVTLAVCIIKCSDWSMG